VDIAQPRDEAVSRNEPVSKYLVKFNLVPPCVIGISSHFLPPTETAHAVQLVCRLILDAHAGKRGDGSSSMRNILKVGIGIMAVT